MFLQKCTFNIPSEIIIVCALTVRKQVAVTGTGKAQLSQETERCSD